MSSADSPEEPRSMTWHSFTQSLPVELRLLWVAAASVTNAGGTSRWALTSGQGVARGHAEGVCHGCCAEGDAYEGSAL